MDSHASAAPSTGTTIVACTYKGGVVLGCDGRVSVGNYISNRASNKIAPLAETIFLCRSGSAPDTQIISDNGAYSGRSRAYALAEVLGLWERPLPCLPRYPRHPPVRHYLYQVAAESGEEPSVELAANLVRMVSVLRAQGCGVRGGGRRCLSRPRTLGPRAHQGHRESRVPGQ